MKEKFLLQQGIYYLNHGSFGACPKEIFEIYQNFQIELEQQPVDFLIRKSTERLNEVRNSVVSFLNAEENSIAFIPNTTYGVNSFASSFELNEGDEVLTTNMEYGACDRVWRFYSKQKRFTYNQLQIKLPITNENEIVDLFIKNVNPKTKVIFLSHIVSSTSLVLPVEKICEFANSKGIITVIDGAHCPGQINLDIKKIGADIYIGNFHKWILTPKTSAFIYCKQNLQELIKPSVLSWGSLWEYPNKNQFIADFEMQGTRDYSALLTIPFAIDFWKKNVKPYLFDFAKNEILKLSQNFSEMFRNNPLTEDLSMFNLMYSHILPNDLNGLELKDWLWEKCKIEIPIMKFGDTNLIRASFQIYNNTEDYDYLIDCIKKFVMKK